MAIRMVIVFLPTAAQADNRLYEVKGHTVITLTAGSAKDYWSNSISYLASVGDKNGMILSDDAAAEGENGATYQKLAARSKFFDQAFVKAECEGDYDIVVQKGETFYIAVKHDIYASGYAYLSGLDAVLSYAAGVFSPKVIGGNFGSHPANRMMNQTLLTGNTVNVQQAAFETGLLSKEYEYSISLIQGQGKEGVCASLINPSVQKPPVASQTAWDVLIPLTANRAGVYTIKYTDKVGSVSSSLWYADTLQTESSVQAFASEDQIEEGSLQVNDIRIRVLSDGPELTAQRSAIRKQAKQQVTLKLNKNGAFHETACTTPSVWNTGVLSGGTVTEVEKITAGLAEGESAIQLTIDTSGVAEDSITIEPNASITSEYADCGMVLLELVTKPAATVDLSAAAGAVLQVSSATDRFKIIGDTQWTTAGAKTVSLSGTSGQDGMLDRLQVAVADGTKLSDAIIVISKNDDKNDPAAANKISVSRAAAPSPLSIDYQNEKITGAAFTTEYAFDTQVPNTFTGVSGADIAMNGHEPGTTLYYRTKSSDAETSFPSHIQSLPIPERPVLQPVSTNTSVSDRERGCTTLQLSAGETGIEYSINSEPYADMTGELIHAAESDTLSVRLKATPADFCSAEQQLNGEGFSYGTVTGHANHGTASATLQLKGNGVTFEDTANAPVEVVVFNRTDGSRIEGLEATANAATGSTVMNIALKQGAQKNGPSFDSQYGYYVALPAGLLSEKQDVNQHKTLGESSVSAKGFAEITLTENGHRIVQSTAIAATGSGKGIPYSVQLSEGFIPSGTSGAEMIVEGLRDGEQIKSVSINGAAVSVTKIAYDTDTGSATFLYPAINCDGVLDVSLSIETQPVVRQLSGMDIFWDTDSIKKVYDGTSEAPKSIPSCNAAALYDGHADIQIKAASIDFVQADGTKTANVGTGLKIIASGITLTGTDGAYYELPENFSMELTANGFITKAKATGLSLSSPVAVQSGAVNAAGLIDKIFSSKVLIQTSNSIPASQALPFSDFIGSADSAADRNRVTGALFTFTAKTSGFEQFLDENLTAAMAILSVVPASGDDANASKVKNKQAIKAAVDKLNNPENSGQAAVMRSLLQAYFNSLKSGSTFAFELPATVLLSDLPEGNYDFSSMQSGISGTIAIKAEGDFHEDEEADSDLYLVVYEVDPMMGSLTGDSAEKVVKGKTPEFVPSVTAKSRYTFEGWLLDGKAADPGVMTVLSDITFTAGFVKGFMHGDGNGGVRPGSQISRAEFVKMAVYTFGTDFAPETAYDVSMYQDVPESQWYQAVVGYATKMKWISGHDGKFRPNDKITRQEAAKLVSAAMGVSLPDGSCDFSDSGAISDWSAPYIAALTQSGVLNGYEDNTFRPLRNISRAEAASMIGKADGFQPDEQRRKNIRSTSLPFSDIGSGHWAYPEIAYACGAIDQ